MTTDIPRGALPGTGSLTTLGTGGEGTVYDLPADSVPQQVQEAAVGRRVVYKQFRTPDSPAEAEHHRAVVEFLRTLGKEQREWLLDRAAWPLAVVEDDGAVCGILMPRVPDRFFRNFPLSGGRTRRGEAGFQMLLNDGRYLDRMGLSLTGEQKYALLAEVSDLLRVLQGGGVVVGDLSARNLMFCQGTGSAAASVYLIDCDSVSVPGSGNPDSMETPGWEVPAGEEKQTGDSDRYKFGLLALRLLVGDQQTRDPGRLPEDTAGAVTSLVTETLREGTGKRPPLGVWNEVLQRPQGKSGLSAVARGGSEGFSAGEEVAPSSPVKEESPEEDSPEVGNKSWYRHTGVIVAAVVLLLAIVGGVGIYSARSGAAQDHGIVTAEASVEEVIQKLPAGEPGKFLKNPKLQLHLCGIEDGILSENLVMRPQETDESKDGSLLDCTMYNPFQLKDTKISLKMTFSDDPAYLESIDTEATLAEYQKNEQFFNYSVPEYSAFGKVEYRDNSFARSFERDKDFANLNFPDTNDFNAIFISDDKTHIFTVNLSISDFSYTEEQFESWMNEVMSA